MAKNNSLVNMTLREPTRFRINTQFITADDLSLFMDSIDTISRLKRERIERRKLRNATRVELEEYFKAAARRTPSATSNYNDDRADQNDENKKVSKASDSERSEYDETYFSGPNSNQSSPHVNDMHKNKQTYSILTLSDSDESGVYPIDRIYRSPTNSTDSAVADTPDLFKTHKQSRLLRLLRKRDDPEPSTIKLISCRALEEQEILKVYQEQQQQTTTTPVGPIKLKRFSTFYLRKRSRKTFVISNISAEERALDKAMQYLTL